ncbi:MAG: Putative protease [Nitrospira sp.]|nr:MAG: Putative protease [Nitrospira sp.]
MRHPDLAGTTIREASAGRKGGCLQTTSVACMHGTFVAGILSARRASVTPGICPDCTLVVRPIFSDLIPNEAETPTATPEELASAIVDCMAAGAQVLNLSVGLIRPSIRGERLLQEALDAATRQGVLVVAAAGNQGTVGSSTITRHPWVIPVVACNVRGVPLEYSNLGCSIGTQGLCAPGERVMSLGIDENGVALEGTSVATPFVTGTIALLWSLFPNIQATRVRFAVTRGSSARARTVVPPLLNAWNAYQSMVQAYS